VNHSKIAICVSVMNEVQFLFASKPCKPLKPRFLDVVFLVEKDVRVKRRRACDYPSVITSPMSGIRLPNRLFCGQDEHATGASYDVAGVRP